MFVKPLWLVSNTDYTAIPTTLREEQEHRRFATRPGLCVTADSPKEATQIAWAYRYSQDSVQQVIHPATNVPVLMAQPRW
jgi:hypothetical protein